jgi:hypothetical protein
VAAGSPAVVASRTKERVASLQPSRVDDIERTVRAKGAVPVSKLCPERLTRNAEARLHESLAQRGFERAGRFVRVPLETQILALLDRRPVIPLQALRKEIAGVVSQQELRRVIAEIIDSGHAKLVVRNGKDHLAAGSATVLSQAEIETLSSIGAKLSQYARAAKSKRALRPRSILREDLAEILSEWPFALRALEQRTPPGRAMSHDDAHLELIVDAAARLESSDSLVFVPQLVRALQKRLGTESILRALLTAAMGEKLELRPESGVGTLSPEDAALCPRGPNGIVLSYARRIRPTASRRGGASS